MFLAHRHRPIALLLLFMPQDRTCLHLFISLLLCCCRQICAAIIIFTCPVPTFHGQCIRNKNCILYSGDEYILGSRHDGSASWLSVRTQEKDSEVAKDNRESIIYLSGRILKYHIYIYIWYHLYLKRISHTNLFYNHKNIILINDSIFNFIYYHIWSFIYYDFISHYIYSFIFLNFNYVTNLNY